MKVTLDGHAVTVLHVGAEGGSVRVLGRCKGGAWSFWQEVTSMALDDDDQEYWHSWSSDPVPILQAALPSCWWNLYPLEVRPLFWNEIRTELQRHAGPGEDGVRPDVQEAWRRHLDDTAA